MTGSSAYPPEHRWAPPYRRSVVVAASAIAVCVLAVAGYFAIHQSSSTHRAAPPTRSKASRSASATVSAPTLTTVEGPSIPATGAYLGAWVNPDPFTQPGRVSSVQSFEADIGAPLRIVHTYRTWTQPVGTASDLAFAQRGSYLLISWAIPDTLEITSGVDDATIVQRAQQIAALPTKVFLEFRWEMDRPNLQSVVHSPAAYIAAWKHVRAIFAQQHVTNVAWTWCPTVGGFANGTAPNYYPGDDQVDWICADVYPSTPWLANDYEPFSMLTDPFMAWAVKHNKPILIGETAVGATYGSRRAQWITDAGAYIEAHPQIKGVLWFEQSLATDPPYYQWNLVGDPPALAAFAKLAQSSYFKAGD